MPQYDQDTNVIGLDPGRSDLFVTTDSLDNSTSCSNKEWRHISGANRHLRKKKFWLKKEPFLSLVQNQLPPRGVADVYEFRDHLFELIAHQDDLQPSKTSALTSSYIYEETKSIQHHLQPNPITFP